MAVLILLNAFSLPAGAWGRLGHQTVALIAEQNLTPAANQLVQQIVGKKRLGDLAFWADSIKRVADWKHTSRYHYVSFEPGADYYQMLRQADGDNLRGGDVMRAMLLAEDMLRDPQTSQKDKYNALAFLVHFIGDIHQPLHAGFVSDRGGNNVRINWYGKTQSLHSVWDSGLIQKSYPDIEETDSASQAQAYLDHLSKPSRATIERWSSLYMESWMQESITARDVAYEGLNATSETYRKKAIKIADQRVLQAGYRLASLLNDIATQRTHPEYERFRREIKSIIGRDLLVSLRPGGR